ncbi:protein ANTAGONIST OF LIKE HETEROCHROMATIN PROTEIN 1-like [Agrilus planipennis]|uniref:Protein ANTAGONIST OF LIKE HETEROCHROMATIN PROTEIN 1-like n=1 Tax=Agrilus planipennis TaxID=224129 RepID=A0A1W4X8I4_AGRPL|nr:protein ANTAGONIST OF LIKE HETEROCHROMATIN PROTEIN 1-like [Agrilus planipennis]XP_025829963.1 protein ANTAGONIST OF LIKE HETEROCHROMATIN PROTEIN 1-like [Agrilus planipennis]
MNRGQIIAWLLHRRRKRQRRKRLHWVHPINQKREEVGLFYTLFEDLRNDERKFFNYFRMSAGSFDELHGKLQNVLQRQNTQFRNCIQPIEMLAITLRYLASGCTFTDLHYQYRVGISTARKIVQEVCKEIWSIMRVECIPTPTCDRWESIASDFETTANFPHCLGAVDGKHIRLTCPFNSGSMYFNYKDYFSIVLMAVVDSKYKFVYVDVGSYGKECDSSIFKRSNLWKSIENNTQQLPEERLLAGTESPKIPYFFVADEAFGLHKHLLRPFGGKHLTIEKRVFNYRLCRARRYVECAFGILSNKWRVLHRPINVQTDFAVLIVNACIVLHNYVRDRDGYIVEDTTTITGLDDLAGETTIRGGLAANNIRSVLCKYFMSNLGSVPWQMSKI